MEERSVSSPVLLLTGTVMSQNPRIPVSWGNPVSCVQAADNGSAPSVSPDWQLSSVLPDRQLSFVPGPDGRESRTLVN